MHGTGGFAGGMSLGWLVWLLFIALLIWTVKSVLDSQRRNRITVFENRNEDAIDILKERYARGEIDEQEFEQRKRMLQ
ncbi:MAG: SHOCT domain-containing protein [candidate division KSB1 bacterium]|nr:SHOCT domain-containing protein [candidate division KSB1 bacterium]MDQ7066362.1 SHOCT domain-containing protein [candidate division KSB1 bacterium]